MRYVFPVLFVLAASLFISCGGGQEKGVVVQILTATPAPQETPTTEPSVGICPTDPVAIKNLGPTAEFVINDPLGCLVYYGLSGDYEAYVRSSWGTSLTDYRADKTAFTPLVVDTVRRRGGDPCKVLWSGSTFGDQITRADVFTNGCGW